MPETSQKPKGKLYLLDAYALIFRAYYAFIRNPRINSKGFNTSAIFGFVNSLQDILHNHVPSHIAVVFDPPGPNFRHEKYPEYKANRDATPEDIIESVPWIKDIISGFNIPVIEVEGYEADDVIGSLAKKACREDYLVYMVTPDKDYMQLVSEGIFMLKPSRAGSGQEIMGVKEVCEHFEIERPEQVIDILALWGDAADNIPGAPGIGEKTSKKLISEFGSVEELLKNTDKLKGKQRENLENFSEQVLLSKDLVTIRQDTPADFDAESFKKKDADKEKLIKIFEELEFRTLGNRIFGDKKEKIGESRTIAGKGSPAGETSAIQGDLFGGMAMDTGSGTITPAGMSDIKNTDHDYILADTAYKRKELLALLKEQKEFCFDTETTGLDVMTTELVGLAFSFKENTGWYVPFPEEREATQIILDEFRDIFTDESKLKIGQNLKFDIHVLLNYGMDTKGELFDTMIAHYLLEPDQKHNLNFLSESYLNYKCVEIEQLIGKKGPGQKNMRSVPLEKIKEYAAEDADVSYRLKKILKEKLEEKDLISLAGSIEMPLIRVLTDMERAGISLDTSSLSDFEEILRNDIIETEAEIHKLAGFDFNVSSPRQLGEVLFERLKIPGGDKKTKSKQYSTGEEVLVKLKEKHPIVKLVLEYRSLRKLLNTYVESLPKLILPQTGKIHSSFNQAIAATGRLSSVNPNLQNIPIREERGREIRKAFIPSGPDYKMFSADYSQIELRIMAHMSGDKAMIDAFARDEDIHTATAALVYKLDIDKVTREMRTRAKTANFGIIYGISAYGLSQRLNIPRQDASMLIEGYFESYPGIREFMDKSIEMAREKGYVETIMGRRRVLNDINSRNGMLRGMAERNAINAPIQGSAADIIKMAMIRVNKEMKSSNMRSKMVLQVHDELIFDVFRQEEEELTKLVLDSMENVIELKVKLKADFGIGNNWLEAH